MYYIIELYTIVCITHYLWNFLYMYINLYIFIYIISLFLHSPRKLGPGKKTVPDRYRDGQSSGSDPRKALN